MSEAQSPTDKTAGDSLREDCWRELPGEVLTLKKGHTVKTRLIGGNWEA